MNEFETRARAYSPRTAQDPLFVRDSIGAALFGVAEQIVAARAVGTDALAMPPPTMLPPLTMPPPAQATMLPPLTMPPPAQAAPIPSPLTVPAADIASALPDTGPTLDDFTRHGTLPGFGDAAQDPYGSALRRRLTVLLRSS